MCNATGHLYLLLTQVKGCVLSLQLSCCQIAIERPFEGSEKNFFLSGIIFTLWITTKAVHAQSFGCGWGMSFPPQRCLQSFQGSTLTKEILYLLCYFIVS